MNSKTLGKKRVRKMEKISASGVVVQSFPYVIGIDAELKKIRKRYMEPLDVIRKESGNQSDPKEIENLDVLRLEILTFSLKLSQLAEQLQNEAEKVGKGMKKDRDELHVTGVRLKLQAGNLKYQRETEKAVPCE